MNNYVDVQYDELSISTKIHMLMLDLIIHTGVLSSELENVIFTIKNELTDDIEITQLDLTDERNNHILCKTFFESLQEIVQILNEDRSINNVDPWILQNIKAVSTHKRTYRLGEIIPDDNDARVSMYEDLCAQQDDLIAIVALNIKICFEKALREDDDFNFIEDKPMCWNHDQYLCLERSFDQSYCYNSIEMYREFRLDNMVQYIKKLYAINAKVGEL